MDRLTNKKVQYQNLLFAKLAEYENTGFQPSEIENIVNDDIAKQMAISQMFEIKELKQQQNKVAIDYLNKLFDNITWDGWSSDTEINAMELYTTMQKLIQELKGEK